MWGLVGTVDIGPGVIEGLLVAGLVAACGSFAALFRLSKTVTVDREKMRQDAIQAARDDNLAELKAINASLKEQRDFFQQAYESARVEMNGLRERIALLERDGTERRQGSQRPKAGGGRRLDPD